VPLIPTGFHVKPLVGAVRGDQRLARYLPVARFMQLLTEQRLWFTRVLRWRDMDACEASLLPAYRRSIMSGAQNPQATIELEYLITLMEFQLRANLGCCFSLFTGSENNLMWRAYAPPPDCGVIIVVRADAVHSAVVANGGRPPYLARVRYLTHERAKHMRISDCPHFRHKDEPRSWDLTECTFFKRDAFKGEEEVRCVIRASESWTLLLQDFLSEEGIPELPIETRTPTDQPYVRLDMRDSMAVFTPRDRVAFISLPQMNRFKSKVESECEAYLDASGSPATSRGVSVPFDIRQIEEIFLHPQLSVAESETGDAVRRAVESAGLGTHLRDSVLRSSSW
jgi:hypothetical protein